MGRKESIGLLHKADFVVYFCRCGQNGRDSAAGMRERRVAWIEREEEEEVERKGHEMHGV